MFFNFFVFVSSFKLSDEFAHLVSKFPHEWLNFLERLQYEYNIPFEVANELEKIVINDIDSLELEVRELN